MAVDQFDSFDSVGSVAEDFDATRTFEQVLKLLPRKGFVIDDERC
jgi:hypothetical protein